MHGGDLWAPCEVIASISSSSVVSEYSSSSSSAWSPTSCWERLEQPGDNRKMMRHTCFLAFVNESPGLCLLLLFGPRLFSLTSPFDSCPDVWNRKSHSGGDGVNAGHTLHTSATVLINSFHCSVVQAGLRDPSGCSCHATRLHIEFIW